ncbi:hypothetical protein COB52_05820 [Candidatus Kaiserbacteria bacterium]|nr:MAG: hypothetical protein COB52_05820 [Candidatus Kaiserbacteria bacterium]
MEKTEVIKIGVEDVTMEPELDKTPFPWDNLNSDSRMHTTSTFSGTFANTGDEVFVKPYLKS